jgi:membrane-bound lytic murein transglycosylase B
MTSLANSIRIAALAAVLAVPAAAATEPAPFATWVEGLRSEAMSKGISRETLDAALKGIQPIPRVLELDRKQPEFTLTFPEYMAKVVPQGRIDIGKQKLRENKALLTEIGNKYGVQPKYIVAFWGIETDFGRITGGFSVVPALATLAYDGRRSDYFRKELINALTIINGRHIDAEHMTGSWAGAMGQTQFMPSTFVSYAVDYDGDGRKDIWTNKADALASAANYLAKLGWRSDETWGRPVKLPDGFDRSLLGNGVKKPLAEWQKLGVRRSDGGDLPMRDLSASVVTAEDKLTQAFLVYGNYQAILKWNRSIFFAVAVGTLAERIGEG